jgi:hypothetical protein
MSLDKIWKTGSTTKLNSSKQKTPKKKKKKKKKKW